MTAESKTTADPDVVRVLAQARGLTRAHALFPDLVVAAFERGSGAAKPVPAEVTPVTEPAPVFDARRRGTRP